MTAIKLFRVVAISFILMTLIAIAAAPAAAMSGLAQPLDPATKFYVPKPDKGAIRQVAQLVSTHHKMDAVLVAKMITTPQAVWFEGGHPKKYSNRSRTP